MPWLAPLALVLAITLPAAAEPPAPARVFTFADSPARVVTWTDRGTPHTSISLDGRAIDASGPTSYDLLLRYRKFDPLVNAPDAATLPPGLAAAEGDDLRIVQFVSTPIAEYRAALNAAGARILRFIGNHAYLVRADADARGRVAALPFVRWVGPFHPAYKLEEYLLDHLPGALGRSAGDSGNPLLPARDYSILVIEKDPVLKQAVADHLLAIGGTLDAYTPVGGLILATLTPAQLLDAARHPGVLFIDRRLPVAEYLDIVRVTGGANALEAATGFTGQGVRAEVMDSGLRTTHVDFQANPPIIHGINSTSTSHGTSVYGIVFGTGTGSATARGLIPSAQGLFCAWTRLSGFGGTVPRRTHIAELLQAPYFAVFQTNSWGSCCTTAYTTAAADMDDILFDNPIVLLQAQANQGNQDSDVIAFAKNLVSVGAVRHQNTLTLADDTHGGISGSTGPASDGRIKPDLAFWYDNIRTTSSTSNTSYTDTFGGTSAATPTTAGHFGLFFQMWHRGTFGNAFNPAATVFDNRPAIATSKAILVNACSPYPFTGTGADLRRMRQGWGRADVARLHSLRDRMLIVNESALLTNLQTHERLVTVRPGEPELRATLVYTDPAGVPNSSRHRINDLSLRVTSPSGTVYWGNNGLDAGNTSTAGGAPNTVDTVENVWITAPAAGVWRVAVVASEIVQDGYPATPATDAAYALVVSGVDFCRIDYNNDGEIDFSDIEGFIAAHTAGTFGAWAPGADLNRDLEVDFSDVETFIALYAAGCPTP